VIDESGGWEDRTTAEDMDLALRAGLLGWEFVYVGSIKVFLPHFSSSVLP
jgi:beta-mannan synthase